jgi:hypothetical protein
MIDAASSGREQWKMCDFNHLQRSLPANLLFGLAIKGKVLLKVAFVPGCDRPSCAAVAQTNGFLERYGCCQSSFV